MKWLGWIVGIGAFCVMLYACALPGDLAVGSEDGGLPGTYTVNGVDSAGQEYSGTVVIRAGDSEDSFLLEWIITGSILEGTATRSGDDLTVEWRTTSAAIEGTGTATYTIDEDGALIGTRSVDGVDEVGTEEIFPEA